MKIDITPELQRLLEEARENYRSGDSSDINDSLRDLLIHFGVIGEKSMRTIYLVGVGEYSQRMPLSAFSSREAAEQYRAHYAAHPPRTLGPTSPVWIEELPLYESADEAIEDDAT